MRTNFLAPDLQKIVYISWELYSQAVAYDKTCEPSKQ